MRPFTTLTSVAAPLYRPNIDTDTIIPSREITSVGREGLGAGAFAHWRYLPNAHTAGTRIPNPAFVLNRPAYAGAQILLGGENFGCGSSREAAVWALEQLGIRAVIAPSFGAIFRANCFANGLLPVQLPGQVVEQLADAAEARACTLTIDLHAASVMLPEVGAWNFTVDEGNRIRLLEGLDDIGMTLKFADDITAFQNQDRQARPWVWLAAHRKGRP